MIRATRKNPADGGAYHSNPQITAFKERILRGRSSGEKESTSTKKAKKADYLVFFKPGSTGISITRKENPDDFNRALFVLKACSRDKTREYLTVLHVEQTRKGSRLVATDGRRLHVAEIAKKIKSGDYKPVITKEAVSLGEPLTGINFPAWSKVIPEKTRKRGVINLAQTGLGKDRNETDNLSRAFNAFVKQTGEPVNLRYLEDLTKTEWTVYSQSEKLRAIVLKENNAEKDTFAVFMPLAA